MTSGVAGTNVADPDLYLREGGLKVLGRLQRECPVYWNELPDGSGIWVITRYCDAVAVYRDSETFTSREGVHVGQLGRSQQPGADKMLVQSDREGHRRMRAVLGKLLMPASLSRLLPALRSTTRKVLDDHIDGDPCDVMGEIAGVLTIAVLAELLGVPEPDRGMLSAWSAAAFAAAEAPGTAADESAGIEANAHIFAYFARLVRTRRLEPGDDLISALTRPDDRTTGGAASGLSDEEILLNVHLLLAGGHETTRQVLAGAVMALHDHPEEWARLRSDPSLRDTATEEIIRWSSPSLNVMRTAAHDCVLADRFIRAGDRVTLWNPILNRDPAAFPHAHEFRVARRPNRHVGFGMGGHLCLGAWTARQELTVLQEELMRRVRRVEVTGPVVRLRSVRTWGYERLPVRLVG